MGIPLLIGIDLGTTALKVAAFDARSGRRVAGQETPLHVRTGNDGRREQAPASLLKALKKALANLAAATSGMGTVQGVGLAAQGGSGIVVDRATGKACTPMTLWNDARAFPRFQEIAAAHPSRYWRTRTRREEPGMGLARLDQLRETAPEHFRPENIYAGAGDYLYYHLTGQWRQDPCHALQIGCYDARKNAPSTELAGIAGVSTDFFPPLRQGHITNPLAKAASKQFGLPEGTPVAGPYMDQEAGFLSAAHISGCPLQCSLGTAWVGNFQLPPGVDGFAPFQLAIPAPVGDGRLVIQPLLTGNVTWDWALQTFVSSDPKQALRQQVRILDRGILPPGGLVAVPWLNRPHPLDPACLGGCSFIGAGPHTTPEDMLRAVVAGMGYELYRVFEQVAARGAIDSLVLSGGASKSRHFQQLIAALFAPLPVYQLEEPEWMGTRGCLWPFRKRVARARAARIRVGRGLDGNTLQAGRTLYETVYARMYAGVRAGRAYEIRDGESVP